MREFHFLQGLHRLFGLAGLLLALLGLRLAWPR